MLLSRCVPSRAVRTPAPAPARAPLARSATNAAASRRPATTVAASAAAAPAAISRAALVRPPTVASVPRRLYAGASTPIDAEGEIVDAVATPTPAAGQLETVTGPSEAHEFKAETRKLLDIVARSLYTDKEVFIRELISNASDALEKLRHRLSSGLPVDDTYLPLEISVYVDSAAKTLTIQDYGIGMSKDELITNLGTIAHSGSRKYLDNLKESGTPDASIIGQFGVGFYSAFMVAHAVKVYSRSAEPGSQGHLWESDGTGSYSVAEASDVARGTKIVMHLRPDALEFSEKQAVEAIVRKHSNFVGFPVKLNGAVANTVKPLWTLKRSEITDEDHKQFYQFIANAFDLPRYHLHYQTDSPINIRALLYTPESHMEKYGHGRMEPGVSLYSRKVLIQHRAKGLLPEWLRFVKGVVDSEDIPLNLSREHLQDSALISRVSNVITRKLLASFVDEMRADRDKYERFWAEFFPFFIEGLLSEAKWKDEIAKLYMAETSGLAAGKRSSLKEYVERMKPGQDEIYYLVVPSRTLAEASPYYETFKSRGLEVLFLYNHLEEFAMTQILEFSGKKLVSIENADVSKLPKAEDSKEDENKEKPAAIEGDELKGLCTWLQTDALSSSVSAVRETSRLKNTPAIIVDHENASFRKMAKFVDPTRALPVAKHVLEINPSHPLIVALSKTRVSHPELSTNVAKQLLDNALIAAGLLDDARPILDRINGILLAALQDKQ